MANEPGNDVRRQWQEQPKEEVAMSLDEIRRRARKLETTVRRRNGREYIAAVVVLIAFGRLAWIAPILLVRIGAVLIILATLYVTYHMRRNAGVRVMPADMALKDCLEFQRAELVRQRDLLRTVWYWYLLPFVPGLVFIIGGRAMNGPDSWPRVAVGVAINVLVFLLIAMLNQWAARKVQRQIDSLDAAR